MDYIKHLTFILGMHLDTLPAKLSEKIRAMSGDISVVVQPTDHHALKVTSVEESTIAADDQVDTLTAP